MTIGYVTLGTNDLDKAGAFYDQLLGEVGAKRVMTNERMVMWGTGRDQPMLAVCKPHNEQIATVGNGVMVALNVDSTDKVDAVYAKAIELGGTDEGEPGPRSESFYGGYFRDLDGNKLVAFKSG
ncbi:MAG: VOC family protein [Gammaproteobacteria bacterium]|nr:VOC family protein [Gammaproteobacteria bacterium]